MKRGASDCCLETYFYKNPTHPLENLETPEQIARRNARQQLADLVLTALPDRDGVTLRDLQRIMRPWQGVTAQQLRPCILLEAIRHLQYAGLVASTANQPGDDLSNRRYWRVPAIGK